jgi:hypothetical protein
MAKTKWPKIPSYLIPLFQSSHVYLCVTRQQWQQVDECLGVSWNGQLAAGLTRHFIHSETGENLYVVGVFDGKVRTLVHECAHVCFYVCSDVGMPIDTSQPNETYCYMLDRMFEFFLPHIKPLSE